jgi:hypothetical protein
MSTAEIISLIASIASVILAVVAIWLSIVFYQLSSQLSESTKEAAKGIGSSVERLEKLFDKLYSDTFSMMRDTVTDMRKHMWPDASHDVEKATEEIEEKADQKVHELTEESQKQLSELLKRQRITDDKISVISRELGNIMERAIDQSRKVENEASEEAIKNSVLSVIKMLSRRQNRITANDILNRLINMFPPSKVISALRHMAQEKTISLSDKDLEPDTIIEIMK